jgi:hypothetical protein
MPLYARRVADHYPDRERSASADSFVVLSGSFEAGSFHRIPNGPSEGRWSWGAGLGGATANFVASGYATLPNECRIYIARSFRAMLARADLRERPYARPGPPRRQVQAPDGPSGPLPPDNRENISCLVRCSAANGASRSRSATLRRAHRTPPARWSSWPSAIRKHPLTDQGRDLVLDQLRAPRVVKARRKPIHHRGLGDELKDSPKTTSD